MNKNLIQIWVIVFLIGWCLLNLYSIPQVEDLFELVIGFFTLTLIPLIILFLLSLSSKKKCIGWKKNVAITGIFISVITFIVNIVMFAIDCIRQGQ